MTAAINVLGNGIGIANGDTTPATADGTDYGTVSSVALQSWTISNTGTTDLALTGTPRVDITGTHSGDFSVSQIPNTPVSASGQTTFSITFTPSADGVRSATVSIANDDPDDNPFTFDIQGTGDVSNDSPVVTITAPADSSSETEGNSVTFTGTATDTEDGDISANIAWSSSIDGSLGTGASVATSSLSVGTHTITAQVTDSGSASGSDTISLTINAAPAGGGSVSHFLLPSSGKPSAAGGFATSAAESAYPELWDGLTNFLSPAVKPSRTTAHDIAGRATLEASAVQGYGVAGGKPGMQSVAGASPDLVRAEDATNFWKTGKYTVAANLTWGGVNWVPFRNCLWIRDSGGLEVALIRTGSVNGRFTVRADDSTGGAFINWDAPAVQAGDNVTIGASINRDIGVATLFMYCPRLGLTTFEDAAIGGDAPAGDAYNLTWDTWTSSANLDATYHGFAAWERDLSLDEITQLCNDFEAPLRPAPQPAFVPAAAPLTMEFDDDGWGVLDPGTDTVEIYVSQSGGSDANDGLSAGSPVQTLAHAYSLLRDGFPDRMYLKRGDVWTDEGMPSGKSGRSMTEMMVVGAYGTGARPRLDVNRGLSNNGSAGTSYTFFAYTDIHFYCYGWDVDGGSFNPAFNASSGLRWLAPAHGFLFENCVWESYKTNEIQNLWNDPAHTTHDGWFNRCQFLDSWADDAHAQGIFIDDCSGIRLIECLFDHNGWHTTRGDGTQASGHATIFNHSIYWQNNPNVTGCEVTRCITARASSHGMQCRSGGTITGNLAIENGVNYLAGGGTNPVPGGVDAVVDGNVALHGTDINSDNPRGIGIDVANLKSGTVSNNIVAHNESGTPSGSYGFRVYGNAAETSLGVNVTGNTFYEWDEGSPSVSDPTFATLASEENNIYYDAAATPWPVTGTNRNAEDLTLVDPSRDIRTYMSSLGETATIASFMTKCREQDRGNWLAEYTATTVNDYIRAGLAPATTTTFGFASASDKPTPDSWARTEAEGNNLRQGLTAAIVPSVGMYQELIYQTPPEHYGLGTGSTELIPKTVNGELGYEVLGEVSQCGLRWPEHPGRFFNSQEGAEAFTAAVRVRFPAQPGAADDYGFFGVYNSSSLARSWALEYQDGFWLAYVSHDGTYSNNLRVRLEDSTPGTDWQWLVMRFSATDTTITIDTPVGQASTTDALLTQLFRGTTADYRTLQINNVNDGWNQGNGYQISAAYAWDRLLSDAEVEQLRNGTHDQPIERVAQPVSYQVVDPGTPGDKPWETATDIREVPTYAGFPGIEDLQGVTPKITITRTTGGAPMHVSVSASESTMTVGGVEKPAFRWCDFRWDFGAPGTVDEIRDPWSDELVDRNVQVGAQASFVYYTPGDYTITLTMTGKLPNGNTFQATTTTLAVMQEFECFNGNADGGTYRIGLDTAGGTSYTYTAPIAWDADSRDVEAAIEAVVGAGNVERQGYGWTESYAAANDFVPHNLMGFTGSLLGQTVGLDLDAANLTWSNGAGSDRVGNGYTGTGDAAPRIIERVSAVSDTDVSVEELSVANGYTLYYIDSDAPAGGDGSIGSPWNEFGDIAATARANGDKKVFQFRYGSTFEAARVEWDRDTFDHYLIPYGDPNDGPIKVIQDPATCPDHVLYAAVDHLFTGVTNTEFGRITVQGIEFEFSSDTQGIWVQSSSNGDDEKPHRELQGWHMIDCKLTRTGGVGSVLRMGSLACCRDVGLWNTDIFQNQTYSLSCMAPTANKWLAISGSTMGGIAGKTTFDHTIYPNVIRNSLYAYMDFRHNRNANVAINTNCKNGENGDQRITKFVEIRNFRVDGQQNGFDLASNINNTHASITDGVGHELVMRFGFVRTKNDYCSAAQSTAVIGYNTAGVVVSHVDMYGEAGYLSHGRGGTDMQDTHGLTPERHYYNCTFTGNGDVYIGDPNTVLAWNKGVKNKRTTQLGVSRFIEVDETGADTLFDPVPATAYSQLTIDNNSFWLRNVYDTDVIYWGQTDTDGDMDFATWKSTTGQDANSTEGDPGFTDWGNLLTRTSAEVTADPDTQYGISAYEGREDLTATKLKPVITSFGHSGTAPYVLHASAKNSQYFDGAQWVDAYEHAHFEWDFGNYWETDDETEKMRHHFDYSLQDMRRQVGGEASYCYRQGGAQVVTLTMKMRLPNGSMLVEKTSRIFHEGVYQYFAGGATGGTFRIGLSAYSDDTNFSTDWSAPIAFDADTATIVAALNLVTNVDVEEVETTLGLAGGFRPKASMLADSHEFFFSFDGASLTGAGTGDAAPDLQEVQAYGQSDYVDVLDPGASFEVLGANLHDGAVEVPGHDFVGTQRCRVSGTSIDSALSADTDYFTWGDKSNGWVWLSTTGGTRIALNGDGTDWYIHRNAGIPLTAANWDTVNSEIDGAMNATVPSSSGSGGFSRARVRFEGDVDGAIEEGKLYWAVGNNPMALYEIRDRDTWTNFPVTFSGGGGNATMYLDGGVERVYFDSNAAGPGTGTIEDPFNTGTKLVEYNNTDGTITDINNQRSMLKAGSDFTITRMKWGKECQNIGLASYGVGAKPIVRSSNVVTGASTLYAELEYGTTEAPLRDYSIQGINFICDQDATVMWFAGSTNGPSDEQFTTASGTAIVDVDVLCENPGIILRTATRWYDLHAWGCTFDLNGHDALACSSISTRMSHSHVGCTLKGVNGSSTFDHHIYPNVAEHSLYRNVYFGHNPSSNYCVNTNAKNDGAHRFHWFTGNRFGGASRGVDASNVNNDYTGGLTGYFDKFVISQNHFYFPNTGAIIFQYNINRLIYRHNTSVCTDRLIELSDDPNPALGNTSAYAHVYRNRHIGTRRALRTHSDNWYIHNNEFYTTETAGNNGAIEYDEANLAGWSVDGNKWWAPNETSPFFASGGTGYETFAQWQARGFDANGSEADPDWPTVTISSPASGSNPGGTLLTFTGTATDTQDGTLSGNLVWESDKDGVIGTGATFDYSALSANTHSISARVLDYGEGPGYETVSLSIGVANTAPVVSITAPANGTSVQENTLVTFTGTATDTEDGDISADIAWSSSLDGSLGTGASVNSSTLSVGSHTITALVTDSGGSSGSDTINLTITAAPAPGPSPEIYVPSSDGTILPPFFRFVFRNNTGATIEFGTDDANNNLEVSARPWKGLWNDTVHFGQPLVLTSDLASDMANGAVAIGPTFRNVAAIWEGMFCMAALDTDANAPGDGAFEIYWEWSLDGVSWPSDSAEFSPADNLPMVASIVTTTGGESRSAQFQIR